MVTDGGPAGRAKIERMRCPFPGMDPWLEHPALGPDVHDAVPPVPPLLPDDVGWARDRVAAAAASDA